MAELLGLNENFAGRRIPIPPDGAMVGRDPRNHIVLGHESISSMHGILRVEKGVLYFRDQQSTNGTRMNGQEIAEAHLQDGDELEIGFVMFKVVAPEMTPRNSASSAPPAPVATPTRFAAPRQVSAPPPSGTRPAPQVGFLQKPSLVNTLLGIVALVVVAVLVFAVMAFFKT